MMKKIIAILLVIMMFLTLTACSQTTHLQPSQKSSVSSYSERTDVISGEELEESDDGTALHYNESKDNSNSSDKIATDVSIPSEKEEKKEHSDKMPSLEGTEQTEPPRVTEEATKPKIPQDSTAEEKKDTTPSKEAEVTKPTESQTESSTEQKAEDTTLPPETESTEPPKEKPPADEQKKDEETKPAEQFDITYWINYAKDYAQSKELNLDSAAVDCWDNPIRAGAHCMYLERDIQSRLSRYARDEDITDVWIWAEAVGNDCYDIYIGYA